MALFPSLLTASVLHQAHPPQLHPPTQHHSHPRQLEPRVTPHTVTQLSTDGTFETIELTRPGGWDTAPREFFRYEISFSQ